MSGNTLTLRALELHCAIVTVAQDHRVATGLIPASTVARRTSTTMQRCTILKCVLFRIEFGEWFDEESLKIVWWRGVNWTLWEWYRWYFAVDVEIELLLTGTYITTTSGQSNCFPRGLTRKLYRRYKAMLRRNKHGVTPAAQKDLKSSWNFSKAYCQSNEITPFNGLLLWQHKQENLKELLWVYR